MLLSARRHPSASASLLLFVLAGISMLAGCGKQAGSGNLVTIREGEGEEAGSAIDEESRLALEKIANLGYLDGNSPRTEQTGVTVHEAVAVHAGYNFYVSNHMSGASLIDMNGALLHRWTCASESAFPVPTIEEGGSSGKVAGSGPQDPLPLQRRAWRRARLLPGGEVLAIFEGIGLVKLDRNSRIIWALRNHSHHDLDLDERGTIFVLCREAENLPRFGDSNPVITDYVRSYTPDGSPLDSISIDQAFQDSEFGATGELERRDRDVYHTNTISILDGRHASRHPAFRKGNLLLCFRSTHEIGILDPAARKMVWVARGPWKEQHEPSLLEDGRILLFDNQGGKDDDRFSRVLEFDPLGLEISWSYDGTPSQPLHSAAAGTVMKLPNGNILITESGNGRVIEVTRDKRIVWEFINPDATQQSEDRRANIMDCVRVDPAFVADWLPSGETGSSGPAAGI